MQYKAKQKLNYGEEKHALEQEEQANSTLKLDWLCPILHDVRNGCNNYIKYISTKYYYSKNAGNDYKRFMIK